MGRKIVFNEQQLAELKGMLDQGVRQNDIAEHFHVTDDTVRRICRENELQIRMPHKCVCVICGDVFYSNIKSAKTCSKEHHRVCKVCGKDFIVDRYDIRETCSGECTSIDRYGVKHPQGREDVKAQRIQTLMEKYGVINPSQLSDHKEKSQATCLEKYGATSYAGSEKGRAKTRATNLERYGYEEPLADPEYRAKLVAINKAKYGTEHPMRTDEIKEKQQATLLERYGVDNPMKCPEIVNTLKENNTKRFGGPSPVSSPEILEKISNTVMDRYGVPWACMRDEARNYTARSKINRAFEEKLTELGIEYTAEFPLENYSFDFKCENTLIEIDPTASHNAIFGIFDTEPYPKDYHLKKSEVAWKHGYNCIHVFDWDNWNSIPNLLAPKQSIYARNCIVKEVTQEDANIFTFHNHLQGKCNGQKHNVGLYYNDELVQIMTFGRPRYNRNYDLELLRMCTKHGTRVIGGASKLFKHFTSSHPSETIISYCDISKFSGKVYEEIGMTFDHTSDPAKIWSKKSEMITDNLLRQRGYDQLFNTNYGKGTSNEELMLENKWLPVYDCGQKVFVYKA